MNAWIDRWIDGQVDRQMHGKIHGKVEKLMGKWSEYLVLSLYFQNQASPTIDISPPMRDTLLQSSALQGKI